MIELTDAINREEDDEMTEEKVEELKEKIKTLDEGEMVVGSLDNTRNILCTVYQNGVDGMEEEEKATVVKKLMELVQRKVKSKI